MDAYWHLLGGVLEMAQILTLSRPMANKFLPTGLRTWAGPGDVFKSLFFRLAALQLATDGVLLPPRKISV